MERAIFQQVSHCAKWYILFGETLRKQYSIIQFEVKEIEFYSLGAGLSTNTILRVIIA